MTINSFVKDFVEAVNIAAGKVYTNCEEPDPPTVYPTPYGGRLEWKLPGENPLIVHLKNKELIRHKKRWSQVMYMYYLLAYQLVWRAEDEDQLSNLLRNTFVLALDGDIDFRPKSVMLLVDLMNRNKSLGAACGRIHPVGSGLMVYYQKFEYAIGHWLQKSTEHMIGCVLCSPGCFSLFRAEALVKHNTMRTYASMSREAIEYVQFDQGEDRWLCTLLLQRGYKVEYSAASDAYTHCPETFAEFYTQRRRWAPSTMANIMDLIVNYKKTVSRNDNISRPYIGYQVLLMIGTILGPGTIFLMLVGAMVSAFGISNWQSFVANLVPIVFFILICFHAKNDTQILVAQVFSALYALLMMAVMVGISLQLVTDGVTSPSAIFILAMTSSFVVAALAHPQEFWCVAHGLVYFLSVPSMYLLLALYSFINLHVVSWGTREVPQVKTKQQLAAEQLQLQLQQNQQQQKKTTGGGWLDMLNGGLRQQVSAQDEEGSISFGLANLFRCMCCTYPKPDPSHLQMVRIEAQLNELNTRIGGGGFRRRSIHLSRDQNLNKLPQNGVIMEDDEDLTSREEENQQAEEQQQPPAHNLPDTQHHWRTDDCLKHCPSGSLDEEETGFWSDLIRDYLRPLPDNPDEKAKVSRQLLDLRNTVVFGVLMLNSLFVLIVFLLQLQKDTLHVEWPLSSRGKANITYIERLNEVRIDMTYLQLEPINLVLVFFFTLILVIQFVAMLFHRLETLSHILASTSIFEDRGSKSKSTLDISTLTKRLRKTSPDREEPDEPPEPPPPASASLRCRRQHYDAGDAAVDGQFVVPEDYCPPRPVSRAMSQRGGVDSASVCSGSLGGRLMLSRRPKHRSYSIALEENMRKMLLTDPKFAKQARRNSVNPERLDQLLLRTSQRHTPSQSSTLVSEGFVFGTPAPSHTSFSLRSNDINYAEEGDTDSIIEMANFDRIPE